MSYIFTSSDQVIVI